MAGRRAQYILYPIQSMGRLYICLHLPRESTVHVGIYTMHGLFGYRLSSSWKMDLEFSAIHTCPQNQKNMEKRFGATDYDDDYDDDDDDDDDAVSYLWIFLGPKNSQTQQSTKYSKRENLKI